MDTLTGPPVLDQVASQLVLTGSPPDTCRIYLDLVQYTVLESPLKSDWSHSITQVTQSHGLTLDLSDKVEPCPNVLCALCVNCCLAASCLPVLDCDAPALIYHTWSTCPSPSVWSTCPGLPILVLTVLVKQCRSTGPGRGGLPVLVYRSWSAGPALSVEAPESLLLLKSSGSF